MRRVIAAVCLLTLGVASAGAQPTTPEQIEAFMRRAKVVRTHEQSGGSTRPLRLTMTDGTTTHDALFQAIEEKRTVFQPAYGPTQLNFVDSWRYNVAAYRLAELVGLGWMMPVTIEYRHLGKTGSLSWWLESRMDERRRLKEKIQPPDVRAWNRDMYRMRIFSSLVADTDRNLGNVLVSPEWRVIMLDFTRAFRLHPEIAAKEISQCERQLLTRLEAMSHDSLKGATGEYLTGAEADAVIKRRDLLVSHVRSLIAQRGEEQVLY